MFGEKRIVTEKRFIVSRSQVCVSVWFPKVLWPEILSPVLVLVITGKVRNGIKWLLDSFGFNWFFLLFL